MGALDGVKVVEAGLLVQAPQAAETLCAWGAEVIKVELPGFGDQSRWLPTSPDEPRSGYFVGCNRGKRSITVDLRREPGRQVFLRLAGWADVVVTNFKPGTMESWGLGYDDLAEVNPRVVVAAGSTFGPDGPDAAKEGADLSAQAAGGLISTTGADGEPPTPVGVTIADHIASLNLVSGILAALLARERTGRGQLLETSLLGGQIWAQASEYTAYLMSGQLPGRANHGNPLVPGLYFILPTADGWIAIVGVVGPARAVFFDLVGHPELAGRFPQAIYFEEHKKALYEQLAPIFTSRTTDQWCSVLGAAGIRHAPVRDYSQVASDPSVWLNGYLADASQPGAGEVDGVDRCRKAVVCPPVRFSETPARVLLDAPELGAHTEEVLLELGYSWEQIDSFRRGGAI
jgi:formyl-CoA transferase/CoA:oxalate CoA-transferase